MCVSVLRTDTTVPTPAIDNHEESDDSTALTRKLWHRSNDTLIFYYYNSVHFLFYFIFPFFNFFLLFFPEKISLISCDSSPFE